MIGTVACGLIRLGQISLAPFKAKSLPILRVERPRQPRHFMSLCLSSLADARLGLLAKELGKGVKGVTVWTVDSALIQETPR